MAAAAMAGGRVAFIIADSLANSVPTDSLARISHRVRSPLPSFSLSPLPSSPDTTPPTSEALIQSGAGGSSNTVERQNLRCAGSWGLPGGTFRHLFDSALGNPRTRGCRHLSGVFRRRVRTVSAIDRRVALGPFRALQRWPILSIV